MWRYILDIFEFENMLNSFWYVHWNAGPRFSPTVFKHSSVAQEHLTAHEPTSIDVGYAESNLAKWLGFENLRRSSDYTALTKLDSLNRQTEKDWQSETTTSRGGWMSRASASRAGNLNLAGSNPDLVGFNTGRVKPMTLNWVLVISIIRKGQGVVGSVSG